jgi:hypothetical protein
MKKKKMDEEEEVVDSGEDMGDQIEKDSDIETEIEIFDEHNDISVRKSLGT